MILSDREQSRHRLGEAIIGDHSESKTDGRIGIATYQCGLLLAEARWPALSKVGVWGERRAPDAFGIG